MQQHQPTIAIYLDFLTVDDVLARRARRNVALLKVRVVNPLSWLDELDGVR